MKVFFKGLFQRNLERKSSSLYPSITLGRYFKALFVPCSREPSLTVPLLSPSSQKLGICYPCDSMGLTTDITHFLHIICHHPRVLGHKGRAYHHQVPGNSAYPGPGKQSHAHSLDTHLLSTCCMPGYKDRHDPQGGDSLVNPRGEGGSPFPSVRG